MFTHVDRNKIGLIACVVAHRHLHLPSASRIVLIVLLHRVSDDTENQVVVDSYGHTCYGFELHSIGFINSELIDSTDMLHPSSLYTA